jgi:hypothetical protein
MANSNLLRLVRQVNYELNKNVKGRRGGKLRDLLDVYEHSFTTGVDLVTKQVDREIKTRLNISGISDDPRVAVAIAKYVQEVYNNATRKNKKVVQIEVDGNSNHFTARVVPIANVGKTNVFAAVQRLRKEPLRKLAESLQPIITDKVNDESKVKDVLFGSSRTFTRKDSSGTMREIEYRSGGLLQQGHAAGGSVAEKSIFRWAAEEKFGQYRSKKENLNPLLLKVAYTVNTAKADRLKDLKFEVDFSKVSTFDESATVNMRKGSTEERLFLQEIRGAVSEAMNVILSKKGTQEWAAFKSSSSALEVVPGNLLPKNLGRLKPKGRLPKKSKTTTTKNSSELNISLQREVTKISQVDSLKGSGTKSQRTATATANNTNWASLLPIINTKLPPRVIANMRYPGLVNRTGTFANSAKVISVEQTREGFPSFVYDYERDPYNVFDRTLGRSPWNTPARDPRALVDKSVRELVREMAIGRFFTRRA